MFKNLRGMLRMRLPRLPLERPYALHESEQRLSYLFPDHHYIFTPYFVARVVVIGAED